MLGTIDDGARELISALQEQVDTLRWQLRQVANTHFVVAWNVSEDEMTKLHDVFEAQEQVLKVKVELLAKPDWKVFEKALMDVLPGRKDLDAPQIIWAIQSNGQWKMVMKAWWEQVNA